MTLKTMQDKSNGAMIAGIGTPWGASEGDSDIGGYHLVWSRDMYKFANALITAGDTALGHQRGELALQRRHEPSPPAVSRRTPMVNGTPYWNATQMDEQAMPIMLAYRLGPAVYNPLWPKIKLIANYISARGPGPSRSAGRKLAAIRPRPSPLKSPGWSTPLRSRSANNDTADAANWLNAADYWQQNVTGWTYTTQGCPNVNSNCNSTSMYMRINTSGAQGGRLPGGWNPPPIPIRI